VPLIFFAVYGLFTVIKFHWTLPAWIALLPMIMVALVRHIWPEQVPFSRLHAGPSWSAGRHQCWPWSFSTACCCTISDPWLAGYPDRRLRQRLPGLGRNSPEVVHELEQQVTAETGLEPIVAGTAKWSVAAALAFHHPENRHDRHHQPEHHRHERLDVGILV
jgi:dolichol-phosphate mannosyltransferase